VSPISWGILKIPKRSEEKKIAAMMRKATGAREKMWGPGIVGFGS
jgi:hypothetical protein